MPLLNFYRLDYRFATRYLAECVIWSFLEAFYAAVRVINVYLYKVK